LSLLTVSDTTLAH